MYRGHCLALMIDPQNAYPRLRCAVWRARPPAAARDRRARGPSARGKEMEGHRSDLSRCESDKRAVNQKVARKLTFCHYSDLRGNEKLSQTFELIVLPA